MSGPLITALLATVAVGGVAYVLLLPLLSGGARAERRMREIATADIETRAARRSAESLNNRRQQVEETLKKVEERQRSRNRPPISTRIRQAGLDWTKNQFIVGSMALGLLALGLTKVSGLSWPISAGIGIVAGVGVPRWLIAYLKKRREAAFIEELPNAIDVIVRGVKSGLPIGDCVRIIASESVEPVKGEFRHIVESAAVGVPLADACSKMYDRIPLSEANFFGIVITIQQKAGGSLSEALGNLSRVLRDRKKMRAKIKAMSMEAKASASIIACLPVAVMGIVWLTSPNYIELLWTTEQGRLMLAGSAGWMLTGVLVMRKMIHFDF